MKTFDDIMEQIHQEMDKLVPFDQALTKLHAKVKSNPVDIEMVYAKLGPESIACLAQK